MFEVAGININPVDLAVIVMLAISLIIGLIKGFVWGVSKIVILVGGLFAANHFADKVTPHIRKISENITEPYDTYLAYFLIFIAVVVVVSLIAYLLREILKKLRLRSFDRLLGGVLGLFTGALALIVVMAIAVWALPSEDLQATIKKSHSARYGCEILRHNILLFPEQMRTQVERVIQSLEKEEQEEQQKGQLSPELIEKGKEILKKANPQAWNESREGNVQE